MPNNVEEAIEKARAMETAFSIGMELSAYSMISGYLNNMGSMMSAHTNMAMFQPAYSSYNIREEESVERMVERKIREGITAALGQMTENSNNNRNNNRNNDKTCYLCGGNGHFAQDCRQRSINRYRNNNNNNDIECYQCGKRGHIARECRSQQNNNNRNNNQQRNNNFNRNNNFYGNRSSGSQNQRSLN
jgi:hypothetical protein